MQRFHHAQLCQGLGPSDPRVRTSPTQARLAIDKVELGAQWELGLQELNMPP